MVKIEKLSDYSGVFSCLEKKINGRIKIAEFDLQGWERRSHKWTRQSSGEEKLQVEPGVELGFLVSEGCLGQREPRPLMCRNYKVQNGRPAV